MQEFDALKLDHQLCFPLYAASREVVRQYHPLLSALDLTYTQYLAMLVLWEDAPCSAKELGNRLYLDSGTLTPLLKKLEAKGYLTRHRSSSDERNLLVSITEEGMKLRESALAIPFQVAQCSTLEPEDAAALAGILHRMMGRMDAREA